MQAKKGTTDNSEPPPPFLTSPSFLRWKKPLTERGRGRSLLLSSCFYASVTVRWLMLLKSELAIWIAMRERDKRLSRQTGVTPGAWWYRFKFWMQRERLVEMTMKASILFVLLFMNVFWQIALPQNKSQYIWITMCT